MTTFNDPISSVEWVHRETLRANEYNPNKQAGPESLLLLVSLLKNGFTQPIITDEDGNIIDGFHRWDLSGKPQMMERYGGMVPRVVLAGLTPEDKMMATVRHNRARGTHAVLPMSDIVLYLSKTLTVETIMEGLGMEREEVLRLSLIGGVAANELDNKGWSKAWKPSFDESLFEKK
jgi:hypothetical protein